MAGVPDDEWETKMAKLLLKQFDGRAKFNKLRTIMYQRQLLNNQGKNNIYLKFKNSRKLLAFRHDKFIKYVSVFCDGASICSDQRSPTSETCIKENCDKFHVCKFFISGVCTTGSACSFGHNLSTRANKRASESLGLSSFSAKEIHTILFRSHPAVCEKYNTRGCDDDDCPDLHVCSAFLLEKCTAGNKCDLGHSFRSTRHNQWVLNTFNLSHLTNKQLRECILVTNMSHGVTDIEVMPQPEVTSSTSSPSPLILDAQSLPEEETEEYVFSVFSFILKRFAGRTKFPTFLSERGSLLQRLGKADIIDWFHDYSDRFVLYENNHDIKYVAVYMKFARICLNYSQPGTLICNNPSCKYFHVCRGFVTGDCVNSAKCCLSHTFTSGPNLKTCRDLNLMTFTDSEVCALILASNPVVCVNYNTSGCHNNDCPDLHVCSKNILNLCTRGDGCHFGHQIRDSGRHNTYVLQALQMVTWQETMLRKIVIVKNKQDKSVKGARYSMAKELSLGDIAAAASAPESCPDERSMKAKGSRVSTRGAAVEGAKKIDRGPALSNLVSGEDPSKFAYICEAFVSRETCSRGSDCPHYHHPDRLPYLWLIQTDDGWHSICSLYSDQLETSYCDLRDVQSLLLGTQDVSIDFEAMRARLQGSNQSSPLARLSTPSYVLAAPDTPLSFYTQWLWYRRESYGVYTPFYPGALQYTLEEKYLKGQHKYYFEFDELRLMVDTHRSPMTQTNLDTQRATRIVRRPLFTVDVKANYPQMSSLLLDKTPTSVLHQVPEHWSVVDHFQDFELVELDSANPEYAAVQRQFFSTMKTREHEIVHMFRVQNPGLWDKYCSARRAMTPKGQAPNDVKERQLFHGTPTLQAARGICANSFDFRRSGENVGARWGKGAYFSTTAKFSHSYTRAHTTVTGDPLRFMFLGRILVGQYTLGHPSYTKPPERDRLKLYDSCVNDVSNPTIFVIFDLAQSYPEYLIQYTDVSDSRPQPQLRPPTSSPPLRATKTVTSPPPSVLATRVQSYSSTVQTPIKSRAAPPPPRPTTNPSAPLVPRAVTQSVLPLSSTLQSSPSLPDMRVSSSLSPGSSSPVAEQQKSSTLMRKKKNKCVIS
ncbi:hypothetical protein C0Q70_02508 [Pomacea canaliculata]|uniref:Poly [ADP-ribose] polymerase n=2 Tax=Pomacea canaliculata TaxID=400727 RepID=A0A2T7PQ57_POMCA|nr:poly [ADP-ribose] polymerase 12-like isoform X2 [Pomacea canaliculata]XP_025082014.1 poly [ADP-ribose] polymerase 12-like isoform X2 [Pomacea canaliculata]XP_025082015.1 poly [ADP-ribose] polymerase 12-like isoform X2 [Pomacea canaliculata]PVD35545.1 hypothetical protein C0Q70_02508 [Pomacea canaliculata]